jgi:hypothetical protein
MTIMRMGKDGGRWRGEGEGERFDYNGIGVGRFRGGVFYAALSEMQKIGLSAE